ncbi:MAG: hypothetical protein H6867_06570 [Rhodospirillales bacterium]|nr:hypothetical protein [Rhodospirillales bacterium]MCB9995212.1 hypothetical protein [Rhodospirillales bacterium]
MDDKRYITLLGERPYASLTSKFMAAADHKAFALSLGAMAALYAVLVNPDTVFSVIMGGAVGTGIINVGIRSLENHVLFGKEGSVYPAFGRRALEEKAIDKRPSAEVATRSRVKYARQIDFSQDVYKSASQSLPVTAALSCLIGVTAGAPILTVMSLAVVPATVRCLSGFYRFNKLAKGEWAVVDMPAEKQKQETPSRAMPQMS